MFEVAEMVQEGDKLIERNRTIVQSENFEGVFSGRMKKTGWNGSIVKRQVREVREVFQMRIEECVDVLRAARPGRAEKRANVFEKFAPVDSQPFL